MMLLNSAQANKLDQLGETLDNLSGEQLMKNAAKALSEAVMRDVDKSNRIAVFCGRGKNGGDGFLLAANLASEGYRVTVIVCFDEFAEIHPLTAQAITYAKHKQVSMISVEDFSGADVCIDALLGTGVKGELSGKYLKAVQIMENYRVFSVDVPSGLNCDNGKAVGTCVKAEKTYTLAAHKVGLWIYPGADYAGEIELLPIGLSDASYAAIDSKIQLVDSKLFRRLLPKRHPNSHKGTFGRVATFGGSKGMAGSVVMASTAALRTGAGYSYAVVPDEIFSLAEQKLTEVIVKSDKEYKKMYELADALVVGPGYLSTPGISHIMKLAQQGRKPVVCDAEGLNYISHGKRTCPMILTPHPGEFAGLVGLSAEEVNQNRIYLSGKYAKENNAVVVLKGARTVIASPHGEIFINTTGNCGMATAGSGDVLSGIIGGFLAMGASPVDSAVLGVYLHGLAGDLAAKEISEYALTATKISDYIGKAFLYEQL
ncbi:MAG: NAD(P)H-hydrate dehydratase [Clostridia bacterium]|nr:NAD(P)H-hydrate dehydratase [Clostridia bacterium]